MYFLLDRIISERLTVRQTEDEISKLLNKNDDDIPENISEFIERKEPKNVPPEKTHFINYVPDAGLRPS